MSDDLIVQILLEAYQRGREIAAAKKVNEPSHPPPANPVTPPAKPVRARRKAKAAAKLVRNGVGQCSNAIFVCAGAIHPANGIGTHAGWQNVRSCLDAAVASLCFSN